MSDRTNVNELKSVHFIGVGGAGMSGLALVLHERGCSVTGSDLKESRYVRRLEKAGVKVYVGHDASLIDELTPELIVISSAIPESNPELARARELGIDVWHRAEMLSALSVDAPLTVAVAGTHGKTTTSSMVATMLDEMELDPTFLIGGILEGYNTNAKSGTGAFVAEADESDGSFLVLDPNVVVVTNVEAEHLDHYGTLENVEKAFAEFISLVGEDGSAVVCAEDEHLLELAQSTGRKIVSYGFGRGVDYRCRELSRRRRGLETLMSVTVPDGREIQVTILANPGRHNILNATAALAVAGVLGLDLEKAAKALSLYRGTLRRFTVVGETGGITVVDDYAHHPTEILCTLDAASSLDFERTIVVFQPHRYTRTRDLLDEFGASFDKTDKLYVMDVFSAGQMPIPGVSGKSVANAVSEHNSLADVSYIRTRKELIAELCQTLREGDLLITMGAGDVTTFGPSFIEECTHRLEQSGL
ncbi:MAG: UDP-N-acetylmuramate--L-alanine ligase [Atopobiaceae bacterium]|nr:UDP-N-acetylmuramate--L-alanine ligase [Atopobiaceae bacterium]